MHGEGVSSCAVGAPLEHSVGLHTPMEAECRHSGFHLAGPVTNGTISSSPRYGLANIPSVCRVGVIWTRACDRWCGVFQVVKAA
jgi:hypothetical protein